MVAGELEEDTVRFFLEGIKGSEDRRQSYEPRVGETSSRTELPLLPEVADAVLRKSKYLLPRSV